MSRKYISWVSYVIVNVLDTFIRFFPFPTKVGINEIGKPNEDSPVFLTVNYHLTVFRVKRALRGVDCYLLVANSKGVNVWCAAAGGLFTDHDVISIIKTSGIEEKVKHKKVILPQLAAVGVESKIISEKTGWKVVWGPVYATDIPKFLEKNFKKELSMKKVDFSILQRVEMAIAWAFPISLIMAIPFFIFWLKETPFLFAEVWVMALIIFITFPIYGDWLSNYKKGRVSKNIGKKLILVCIFWMSGILPFVVILTLLENRDWIQYIKWAVVVLITVLVLVLDLMGSTPVFKSDTHEDRLLKVVLDKEKCKGTNICADVCPRNCYELDKERKVMTMPHPERCVQCGACIVQCPYDALYFENTKKEIITPDIVRKYKLNLMGKREYCCLPCAISDNIIDSKHEKDT